MRINLIFLLFCLPLVCISQSSRDPRKGSIKGIWAGFSGGADLISNSDLNQWLKSNGVKASSSFDFSYGVKVLVWPKKLVFGAEMLRSVLKNPNQITYDFHFLVGKPLKRGALNIIPLIGIGSSGIEQKFNDTIPSPLYQAKLNNGRLFKERLSIEPQVMLFNRVGKFDSFGVTVGCHIYFWQGDWRYVGDNGKVIENGVPNPSILTSFISVQYGFTSWNIR